MNVNYKNMPQNTAERGKNGLSIGLMEMVKGRHAGFVWLALGNMGLQ